MKNNGNLSLIYMYSKNLIYVTFLSSGSFIDLLLPGISLDAFIDLLLPGISLDAFKIIKVFFVDLFKIKIIFGPYP